jgi:hypothetical protein
MSAQCWATTTAGAPCENPAGRNGLCALHDDGTIRGRCKAITRSGRRCRNWALAGGLCPIHDGSRQARRELNRQLRHRPEPSEPSEFVPANLRGARRDMHGRLRSVLDWHDETRSLP